MAVNAREKHEESLANVFKMANENVLANLIYRKLSPWQRGDGHLPSELDEDVLRIFAVVFDKSGSPANYLGYLQQFYQASHDFRLLAVMVDGVVGHTATKAYPFLQGMTGVLSEVRDEATVDEIMAQIEKTRAKAKSAVDQRVLDLLTLLVRRRAAEVLNQHGPHLEAALTAMQRAFKREWSDGEPMLMSDLLHGLGNITQPALSKEQLTELEQLFRAAKAGSYDRLHIGHRQAQTIHNYGRTAEAIDLLEPALKEYQDANQGILPASANEAISTLVICHSMLGHYARGEKLLLQQLAHPVHEQQKLWLTQQLLAHYHNALGGGGEVSLGKGAMLYKALEAKLLEQLKTGDHNHRFAMFQQLTGVYRTAHQKKFASVGADVRAFAFKVVPEFIQRQTNNYDNIISTVSGLVHDVLGPRDGIAFLLDRIDAEPRWFRLNNQDGWMRHAGSLALWRTEARNLGDLEPRLLKLVLAELRRDLETRVARSRYIYDHHAGSYYWPEKEAEFVKTAEAVLAERKQSGPAAQYIAEYFYSSLGKYDRAIAILFEAHGAKRLEEAGIAQLIRYLHEQKRFAESIALLEPLVETKPEALHYRVQLMHAYFKTQQPAKLLALLKQTDAFFHQKDRWNEGVLATLAASALDNELYQQSIAYYEELIPLHQRTQSNRGIGNGTLSAYYGNAAKAYSAVKNTAKAIDMASGAVISWGPRQDQRAQALQTLVQVMAAASDLDAYVAQRDRETKDAADSPIIRKALGQAYTAKGQHARAAEQFRIAIELQANDAETHQLLIACYDRLGDQDSAIRQLLELIDLSRREMQHYRDLGQRLAKLDRSADAERAYTSAVEMLAAESESHTLLAEVREQQNRWSEAIEQWEQVARIRSLEPTGLLKLAHAQIHEKRWKEAGETVKKLRRTWPPRFGDVEQQVKELERQLDGVRE
jgi:Flp pilus assembly protein TadD